MPMCQSSFVSETHIKILQTTYLFYLFFCIFIHPLHIHICMYHFTYLTMFVVLFVIIAFFLTVFSYCFAKQLVLFCGWQTR